MGWQLVKVVRERNTALYLGGVVVSGFGDSAMAVAAGVWIKTVTGSDSLAALAGFCIWLPTLAGPVVGALADRVRRRPLLVGVNLGLAAVLLAPALAPRPAVVGLLFGVLTVVGVGTVLTDTAETALVAAAVREELRGDFNGLVRTAIESTKLVAPLAGAALFTAFGGRAVAVLDTGSFLLAALAFRLLRVRETRPERSARPDWRAETAEGARYLWQHPVLRPLVLTAATAMVASGLSSTATYALLDTGLHRAAAFAAVLTTVQGAGSMLGGLAAGALMRRMPERAFVAAGMTLFALGVLARATPYLPLVLTGSLAIGVGLPWPLIAAFTAVQRETPGELLGRAAGTAGTLVFAPTGLAMLAGTGLVASLDYRVQTVAAGVLALTAGGLLVRVRRAAARPAEEPSRAVGGGA
ncbi:MFS transporter [Kitasatospora sp. MMS16-BH015]|uniref:MFS transporter n=1 Tax=Kitasatospora sp. MMS16-BH015 TaxID=2018025 RepID=UPI000CF20E66|nr:MFS transporter [Kitasatospora sp. MMS16-BH015]